MLLDAVLLAGGRGRRAGGPKAFKRLHGELAWRRQARMLQAAGGGRVAVVLHPDRPEADLAAPLPDRVSIVRSTPTDEMFASLQAGLRALADGGEVRACLVLPVDCPLAGPPVTEALRAAADAPTPWRVIRPRHGARRGHPIVLSAGLCAEIAAGPADRRLDRVIAALPPAMVRDVEVDDPAILANHNRDGVSR